MMDMWMIRVYLESDYVYTYIERCLWLHGNLSNNILNLT